MNLKLARISYAVRVKSAGETAEEVLYHLLKLFYFLFLFCHSYVWKHTTSLRNKGRTQKNTLILLLTADNIWMSTKKLLKKFELEQSCDWSMASHTSLTDIWLYWWVLCFSEILVPAGWSGTWTAVSLWCFGFESGLWVWDISAMLK